MSVDPHAPWLGVMAYGGAPDPSPADPARPAPIVWPEAVGRILATTPRRATVTARVDESGRLRILLSIDGRAIAEVEGEARGVSITVDV